ncbi:M1 family metallopeptidase [Pendulispora albinea]|uniref:Aminopeptidase N n=1 Tax=Pendulispora albinea TaxID=2741071 RepID=A0ABZ2MB94_9BACT
MARSHFSKHRARRLGLSFLSLLAIACSSTDEPPPAIDRAAEALEAEATDYDVARYDLRGELDWTRSRLVATVGVTLQPRGLATIVLDSAVAAIKAVRGAGGAQLPFTVDTERQKLRVDLPSEARARDSIRLEIDYEAEGVVSSDYVQYARFFMVPALKGDPAPVRAAFTFSERYGAHFWMPSHDTPSDRAIFSVDLRLPAHETMIANGNFVSDEFDRATNTHRVKYDSGFTLPTYIMAFSAGELERERPHAGPGHDHDHEGGRRGPPLSIWHRRGIPNDYDRVFRETSRAMKTFERLVGPYPFASYAQVFMPGTWGEENATVTLLGESYLDYALYDGLDVAGHELAHQWFGDLVTNETFYDAWFKEGMATLLEMENLRTYLDEDEVGLLGSEGRAPREGEPIVRDRSIPILRYGTGPYARAAWLLTQIRSIVGEAAFWRTLRDVLREHRYGTIGTEAFVRAFAPRLGAETTAGVQRALVAKSIPRLRVEALPEGGALVTLRDPEGAFITPVTVRFIAPDGTTREQTLELDTPVALARRVPGELLVIDPLDVHPDLKVFAAQDSASSAASYEASVVPLLVPDGEPARARWLRAGGTHQTTVLARTLPAIAPDAFEAFVGELDSEVAKTLAVQRACDVAADPALDGPARAGWARTIARALLRQPPTLGLSALGEKRLAACGKVVDVERLFAVDWARLESGLPLGGVSEHRVAFLSQFDLRPARQFSVWSRIAKRSNSLNQRGIAVANLAQYAQNALVPKADVPAWRAFFAGLLSESQDQRVLGHALHGVVATKGETLSANTAALAGLNGVLHDPVDHWFGEVHSNAVCAAYALIPGAPASAAWQDFVRGLSDARLKPAVLEIVNDPARCASGLP